MSIFSLVKGGKEHGVFEMRMFGGVVLNSYINRKCDKMNVTILPYIADITPNVPSDTKAKNASDTTASTDASFKETLNSVMKATAALAIDHLVKASTTGAVNADIVQEFFDQNQIPITIANVKTSIANEKTPAANEKTSIAASDQAAEKAVSDSKATAFSLSPSSDTSSSPNLDTYFEEAAEQYQVDIKLLKAIAYCESNFNPNAVSHAGAIGVMQLMPATAAELGVTDSYDARQNILGGAKLISKLLDRYDGDTSLALAAYNAGSGNVEKYGGIPPFTETQNYVKKVLSRYNES